MASPRPADWTPKATHAAWIAAVAALGFALSTPMQQAHALGPPTITLPGITTVTVPGLSTNVVTTTTTAETTTADARTPPTNQAATPTTPAATREGSAVAGMIRLSGGGVSIPVSSVRAPARLRILLSFAPKTIDRDTRPISILARIVDTRGYVVRGARVVVRAGRPGTLWNAGTRMSAVDGLVSFVVRNRLVLQHATGLAILVQAFDPTAPHATMTSRGVRVAIQGGG